MAHVVLVAFEVRADSEQHAQQQLMDKLLPNAPFTTSTSDWLECWWIAEDERYDRSDLNSAVFVPEYLTQVQARDLLRNAPVEV